MNPYPKFAPMIATSTVVMFSLMYLSTYSLDHIFFSATRAYMALMMGATMAVIMLGFIFGQRALRRAVALHSAGGLRGASRSSRHLDGKVRIKSRLIRGAA